MDVAEQMINARYNARLQRWERKEDGVWVEWPTFRIDGAGARYAKREIQNGRMGA